MFCPSCGKELPEGLQFCTACGAKLESDAQPSVAPRTAEGRERRKANVLVVAGLLVLAAIAVLVAGFLYSRAHYSPTAVGDSFVEAVRQSDCGSLRSMMTVGGERPSIAQLQAFCAWTSSGDHLRDVQQQLYLSSHVVNPGQGSAAGANSYLAFVRRKWLLVFNAYSVAMVPSQATIFGCPGTTVTIDGVGAQTMTGDTASFSSLLPGNYPYKSELPTVLGTLNGSGTLAVEPLTGGTSDAMASFAGAAYFHVPSGMRATSLSLNGTSIPLVSDGTGSQTVGPFPAGSYTVAVGVAAPWGTAGYAGRTASAAGSSTITLTGISDATYAKLQEIASVIDTFNTNDTRIRRRELSNASTALQGLEAGSAIYDKEQRNIEEASSWWRSASTSRYLRMTLSSRIYAINNDEIRVVCAESYSDSSPVWVYTLVYRGGRFLLRENEEFSGDATAYTSFPRSIVITHGG